MDLSDKLLEGRRKLRLEVEECRKKRNRVEQQKNEPMRIMDYSRNMLDFSDPRIAKNWAKQNKPDEKIEYIPLFPKNVKEILDTLPARYRMAESMIQQWGQDHDGLQNILAALMYAESVKDILASKGVEFNPTADLSKYKSKGWGKNELEKKRRAYMLRVKADERLVRQQEQSYNMRKQKEKERKTVAKQKPAFLLCIANLYKKDPLYLQRIWAQAEQQNAHLSELVRESRTKLDYCALIITLSNQFTRLILNDIAFINNIKKP